jgi:hypothetical protein
LVSDWPPEPDAVLELAVVVAAGVVEAEVVVAAPPTPVVLAELLPELLAGCEPPGFELPLDPQALTAPAARAAASIAVVGAAHLEKFICVPR